MTRTAGTETLIEQAEQLEVEAAARSWKPYPEYKDSGAPWLGQVPAHWDVRRLKTSLVRNDGGVWGEDFDLDGTIVLRSTEQAVDGKWIIDDPARRLLSPKERAAALLVDGDLVITKSSGSALHIGKTSLVDAQVASLGCCYSNFMQRLRCDGHTDPQFVHYLLNSPVGREQFGYGSNTTTGLANLNGTIIGNLRVAWPSPPEQRAIAAFLDRKTRQIDELIEKKRRLIELLQEKRTALISHAVTKGLNPDAPMKPSGIDWLGNVPEHWAVAPMYSRYSVELGKMLDAKRITGDYLLPYLRNVDVRWDRVNVEDLPEMDIAESEYERFTLRAGDMLVCEGGEVGRTAFWRDELPRCAYQKALHRLRPLDRKRDSPRFLFFVMNAGSNSGVFVAGGNPNTIPHLTGEKLRVYRFAFPPRDEQDAIVSHLDEATEQLDRLVERAEDVSAGLNEYRQAVISAAVTGKIDVREEVAA